MESKSLRLHVPSSDTEFPCKLTLVHHNSFHHSPPSVGSTKWPSKKALSCLLKQDRPQKPALPQEETVLQQTTAPLVNVRFHPKILKSSGLGTLSRPKISSAWTQPIQASQERSYQVSLMTTQPTATNHFLIFSWKFCLHQGLHKPRTTVSPSPFPVSSWSSLFLLSFRLLHFLLLLDNTCRMLVLRTIEWKVSDNQINSPSPRSVPSSTQKGRMDQFLFPPNILLKEERMRTAAKPVWKDIHVWSLRIRTWSSI